MGGQRCGRGGWRKKAAKGALAAVRGVQRDLLYASLWRDAYLILVGRHHSRISRAAVPRRYLFSSLPSSRHIFGKKRRRCACLPPVSMLVASEIRQYFFASAALAGAAPPAWQAALSCSLRKWWRLLSPSRRSGGGGRRIAAVTPRRLPSSIPPFHQWRTLISERKDR